MAIVTMTQALKKLYKAVVGEDTTKNNPTKIVSELADNWSGGGGGGSSDFSTAEVTFSCTSGSYDLTLPFMEENQPVVVNVMTVSDQPVTLILPLHTGALYISLDVVSDHHNPSCTGGVTYDEANWRIAITGDGTFTAEGES